MMLEMARALSVVAPSYEAVLTQPFRGRDKSLVLELL